jgi:hypothetical protein
LICADAGHGRQAGRTAECAFPSDLSKGQWAGRLACV